LSISTTMQKYSRGEKPAVGQYFGFDHLKFLVGNAIQTADWYIGRFGFKRIGYAGLETGSREEVAHVLKQGKIIFVFTSALNPDDSVRGPHLLKHGDGVMDVAFTVDDARAIYKKAIDRGAKSFREPWETSDEHGVVIQASVRTYGDTVHTFVERKNYKGFFLPGYMAVNETDPWENFTGPVDLGFIDHVVGNMPLNEMEPVTNWYEKHLDFHRFWSVDDTVMHTEYSCLKSIVVADYDEVVKMPINEPAPGKRKSQIQEYVDYYGGAGVQHIALNTSDIIKSVEMLTARGVHFLKIPLTYYTNLRERLAKSSITVTEDLDTLQKLRILIDFDDKGYLLQLFTRPVSDRPTLFIEIIQRHNNSGFGVGNFKSLFEAIEREQAERGNL